MKGWWEQLMHLPNDLNEMGVVLSRVNNSCRVAPREPVNTSQTVSSICDREVNSADSDHSSIIPIGNKVCEPEEVLVPALPETACVERGYITPQQVYNLLNAEEGQPALYDPYYILLLDCRSAERYKESHVVTARAAVTVIHPQLGCLISCVELQKYSIILLYAEEGCSPVGSVKARADSPDLQRCFFQLSALGMDPVILLGGFSAFHALYPFLCTPRMVLLEPERHTLTIYPSEILERALYQGSASHGSDYRIIKNLHITHVVNATANCPDAFPNTLCYLRLRLSDDAQQDLVEALPLASRFINTALKAEPAGRVLVHCSLGRSRSSALTLAFLMEHRRWSLLHALRWLKERRACTAPNVNFLRQLLTYEEQLFGRRLTSLDDIRRWPTVRRNTTDRTNHRTDPVFILLPLTAPSPLDLRTRFCDWTLSLRMELPCWCLLLLSCMQSLSAHNDFFTSIGQMTDLLYTEKDLVTSLKDYIRAEENKLEQVKRWADKLDSLSATATQDPEGFLGHPVNAFKLMKRLNTEWGDLESLVLSDTTDGFISNLTIQRQYFPTDEDQTGAAKALLRLQDTYRLDANTISTGDLPGVKHKSLMTVEDCYELGKIAYSDVDYYHTELWMAQALKQLDQGEESTLDKVTLLDYLSYSIYQQGEIERALEYTKKLLELDPEHQRAKGNLKYFEFQLEKQKKTAEDGTQKQKERGKRETTEKKNKPKKKASFQLIPERKKYEMLCRGEGNKMTPRRQSRLFCRYYDNNRNPKYVLAPVKQQDEWDSPYIVRYLDIISDKEIEKIKQLAKPRLRRATISNPITGVLETAPYRISKSAWLTGYEDPMIDKINQRIEDLTGLEMDTAEELQVANYGVGGQYEPHFDFGRKDEPDAFKELGTGNRIATWLFYMSDVAAGGATVFPDVGAAVWPQKGSAVFWYNLFASGEGDYSTRHAACPVLVGNKWVSNKWIHERGQEWRRPCGLNETE